jgi:predicted PurR-regulated permease PerM
MTGAEGGRGGRVAFAVVLGVTLLAAAWVVRPFAGPAVLGAFAAVLFMPAHDALARRLGRSGPLAAGLTTLGVFLLVVLPLAGISALVVREAMGAATRLRELLESGSLPAAFSRVIPESQWRPAAQGSALSALGAAAAFLSKVVGQGARWVVQLFLLLVSLYYFLLDGRRMAAAVLGMLPMEGRYAGRFASEFKDVTRALAWGHGLTALVQAVLGTAGMLLARVPAALLWGVAMGITALIPVGGTALIWAPVGLALLLTGRWRAGLFVLAWGTVVVATVDNLVRPRLMGARLHLHPLATFFCLFGGLAVMGPLGLLVGPLAGALATTGLEIYRADFLPRLRGGGG